MPIKQAGYTRTKINVKLNRKRQEARDRQAAFDKLTVDQKLATLVEGGSNRQRAKLEKLKTDGVQFPKVKPTTAPSESVPVKKAKISKKKIVAEAKAKRPSKS
jgi:hypothetical protein